jgi:hypothetical protein
LRFQSASTGKELSPFRKNLFPSSSRLSSPTQNFCGTAVLRNVLKFYQSAELEILENSNIREVYPWTSEDKVDRLVEFCHGVKRRGRKSLLVIFLLCPFFSLSFSFSCRQRDDAPSFPNHSLKTLFRGWRRSKSLTFLAVWWIVKEKLVEHGSPPSRIYGERDFKDHNRMSEPSSIADKKCTTSKKEK